MEKWSRASSQSSATHPIWSHTIPGISESAAGEAKKNKNCVRGEELNWTEQNGTERVDKLNSSGVPFPDTDTNTDANQINWGAKHTHTHTDTHTGESFIDHPSDKPYCTYIRGSTSISGSVLWWFSWNNSLRKSKAARNCTCVCVCVCAYGIWAMGYGIGYGIWDMRSGQFVCFRRAL